MTAELPEGWVPIPHAVDPLQAENLAGAFISEAAMSLPGFIDDETARSSAAAAMARLPVEAGTRARLWHVLGPAATGLTVDLSTGKATASLDERAGAGFRAVHVQRRIPLTDGLATIAFVAPDNEAPPAILLRAQRVEGDTVLIADVIDTDLGLIGHVLDDVIRLVGAERADD